MTDTQEILKLGIGTKEPETLKPSIVQVHGIRLDDKKNKEAKKVGELIVVICKHPDKEELIQLSNAKTLGAGDKVKLSALWLNKDEDEKLSKKSTASDVLRKYGVENFGDLVGKEIETVHQADNNKYLCIKAY